MSSVSSASSSSAAYYASQKSYFSKLDTDQDGKLTEDEFVAGRPKDVSESQASSLYSKLDSDDSGSLTEDQFDEGMSSNQSGLGGLQSLLSSNAMAVLMLMSPQGGMQFSSDSGGDSSGGYGPPSAADMYSSMDTDGDGSVTEAEFVAARPQDMSEEDAQTAYSKIDTEGTGSITEDQFSDALQSLGGPGPGGGMPPQGAGGASSSSSSSDDIYDALDTNKDGVVSEDEFLAAHPADVTDEQATTLYNSIDTEGTGSITKEQFSDFMKGSSDTDSTSASDELTDLTGNYSFDPTKNIDDLLSMLESLNSDSQGTAAA